MLDLARARELGGALGRNHAIRMTTNHRDTDHVASMFENVLVGMGGDEAGRDAVVLAKNLVSSQGEMTLLHVYVARSKPGPESRRQA